MSKQLGLSLGLVLKAPRKPQPAANTDPPSSHEAARGLVVSGELKRQQWATLSALNAWSGPPPTSQELARGDVALRFTYARRLPELRAKGLVIRGGERRCTVSGRTACVWWPSESGRQARDV